MDRFIPCIKLMYYPTKVTTDPFEYALKSHIMNNQFFSNINQLMYNQDFFNKEKYPEIINEMNNTKINEKNNTKLPDLKKLEDILSNKLNFDNYVTKKFYCDENTLLIIATHGLHKRSQTKEVEREGVRNTCQIGYANQYTRYDLLKLLFRKN